MREICKRIASGPGDPYHIWYVGDCVSFKEVLCGEDGKESPGFYPDLRKTWGYIQNGPALDAYNTKRNIRERTFEMYKSSPKSSLVLYAPTEAWGDENLKLKTIDRSDVVYENLNDFLKHLYEKTTKIFYKYRYIRDLEILEVYKDFETYSEAVDYCAKGMFRFTTHSPSKKEIDERILSIKVEEKVTVLGDEE